MPIKDILHVYECKYCHKRFTMFDGPGGKLIFFPESSTWPTDGKFELIYHLKNHHGPDYRRDKEFYDTNELIKIEYHEVGERHAANLSDERVRVQVLR